MLRETKGLYVVAQTPFREDGAVDFDSIDSLSDFYYRHGANGLTVLGVSGEAAKLTPREAIETATRFVSASGGRPIIAGVSNPSLAQLAEVTGAVMDAGCSGVMIAPASSVRTDEDLLRYFDAIFQRIGDVPTVLQDFPFASGVKMSVPAILKLVATFPQIQVLKEEDLPSCQKITRLKAEMDRPFRILVGNNALYLPHELERGADGPMAGFSFPEVLSGTYKLMANGKRDEAHDLFDRYLPLMRYEALGEWGIAVRKLIMHKRGAIASPAMRGPSPRLSDTDIEEIQYLLNRIEGQEPITLSS
ncbi:dihydrodipicolinate synthase family protein [Notoacmeibacter sp. MSK16QG-6]|uniref:dihydrodipicolinate synthase family protein n=1 Tax=Notoacmeibacter sp. MSK16QG-6 TaxID=2957982 RepID=UPI00209D40AC|nr:dihydrodipicolinate synthase family protein [Notoacmeibacter sp. MSK16QG-6]MCP1199546.1 dihydrodipicolinate synthase family protein [Notoacmeibacter sp. MSK16QG-6]